MRTNICLGVVVLSLGGRSVAAESLCNASIRAGWSCGEAILKTLESPAVTVDACCEACNTEDRCVAFVLHGKVCYLKADLNGAHPKLDNTCGVVKGSLPPVPPTPLPPPPPPGYPNFELLSLDGQPVVDEGQGSKYGIKHGFEGGRWWQEEDGTYTMIPSEMMGDLPVNRPIWDLHTQIGLWRSVDGKIWTRSDTLVNSTSDCTGEDPCGAIFSPFTAFDNTTNRYYLFYTCYATPGCHQVNGQQMRMQSATPGIAGIAGPYINRTVALNIESVGGDPQWWEGNSNCSQYPVNSTDRKSCAGHGIWGLHPFLLYPNGTWCAVYGSAWHVGIACVDDGLGGKWYRVSTNEHSAISWSIDGPWSHTGGAPPPPGTLINGPSIENPILTKSSDGKFWLMVWDAMERYWPERADHLGFSASRDGIHNWTAAQYVLIEPNVTKPCGHTRTPYGLVPQPSQGRGVYAVLFTGDDNADYESICYALVRNINEI